LRAPTAPRVRRCCLLRFLIFFFQAEAGIRDRNVTGVQTCALPIKIAQLVREKLLKSTDYSLTLFAREAHQRIKIENSLRETIVEGDFKDISTLRKAMENQDLVFVATMENVEAMENIVQAMSENELDKLIGIGSLG